MNYICIRLYASFLLLFLSFKGYSTVYNYHKDSLKIKNTHSLNLLNHIKKTIKKPHVKDSLSNKKKLDDYLVTRSFPGLRSYTGKEDFNYKFEEYEPEFTDEFIANNFIKLPQVDSIKTKAKKLINKVKELGKFVDVLKSKQLVELPVGLNKKDKSGNAIQIVISEAKMHPKYAELKIFAKLDIPQKNISLFFGAEGVKFSHKGAFVGETKLVLLGDQPIPFNGNGWLLNLKGSTNLKTGDFGQSSFVTIDCNGLKELSLEADLRVSRKVLLPIDDNGNYLCGSSEKNQDNNTNVESESATLELADKCYVGTSFSVKSTGWNDLLVKVNLPSFEVNGLKGWGFEIENAVLDLSDTKNSSVIKFPKAYDSFFGGNKEEELLWRGVFASRVSVTLPKSIKTGNDKTKFEAKNLLLDSNGVSGYFSGTNIISKERGTAGKWPFTIDSLGINLEVNKLVGGALSGDLHVPIMKKPLDYSGWISSETFGLTVTTNEQIKVPVFLAEMKLEPNSSVSVKVTEDNIYPSANLTGSLTIKANTDQTNPEETAVEDNKNPEIASNTQKETDFTFPGVVFEELEINSEPGKPVISAKAFRFEGQSSLFNFPSAINNVKLLTPSNDTFGLGFDVAINLDSKGSNAKTKVALLANIEDEKGRTKFKFDKVEIDGITVDIQKSGTRIKGSLEVMKNDETYGDGFKGSLTAEIDKINLVANAKAMFGKKDFRYWFVDIWANNTKNSKSKIQIKQLVGGLSYRMHKISGNSTFTPSSSVYEPFAANGLGFKAGVELKVEKVFHGKAFLEMDFNRHGGLNRIGFMGDGAMMLKSDSPSNSESKESLLDLNSKVGEFVEKAKNKVANSKNKHIKKHGDLINKQIDKYSDQALKEIESSINNGDFLQVAQSAIPKGEVAKSGNIGVYVGIEKDFVTDTFHGEFEVYIDLNQIRGASIPNSTLAGRAVIHTSPSKWYLHVGTPETPIRLAFIVAPERFEVGGYFMTGNYMPTQLAPHYRVLQILGDDILNGNRSSSELTKGRGFAFGLSFAYAKDFSYGMFYAFLEAGVGFDVMHREYQGVTCKGRSGPIGNNGWYSMGQVYAYLYGEAGITLKLFFKEKRYPILQAGVAALLRGQFPNPSYFEGYVGAYYSVLGGLVSGRMRLHVDIGEECVIERNADDGLEVPVIADIDPFDKDKEVDVFTSPQVTFNYPIDKQILIPESEGDKAYRISLNKASMTSEGKPIFFNIDWNGRKDGFYFELKDELLPSEQKVYVHVNVIFEEKVFGVWKPVKRGGQVVSETKEIVFKTGKAPDHIPLKNIEYLYPVIGQQNFYKEEYDKGYIKLKYNQDYLFKNFKSKAQFISENGVLQRVNFVYDESKKVFWYNLPEMNTNTKYKFDLVVFPEGSEVADKEQVETHSLFTEDEEGVDDWFNNKAGGNSAGLKTTVNINSKKAQSKLNLNASKSIITYNYKTSIHNSFSEKINSLNSEKTIVEILSANVHVLEEDVEDYEFFNQIELLGSKFSENKSLINTEIIPSDRYFRRSIYPLIYENYGTYTASTNQDDIHDTNGLPLKNVNPSFWYINYLENKPNSPFLSKRIPYKYLGAYRFKNDFIYIRDKIAAEYLNQQNINKFYTDHADLFNAFFPVLTPGRYSIKMQYVTPGSIYKSAFKTISFKNE